MIKTCPKRSFLVFLLLSLRILEMTLFLRDGFRFVFAYEKRELPYSQEFSYNILNFRLSYFS